MSEVSLGDVRGLVLQKLNEETDEFRRALHAILKSKGFERTFAGNRSAMYNWDYKRLTEAVSICGWHGTGKKGTNRWWGDSKTVMNLYYTAPGARPSAYQKIVEIDNFTSQYSEPKDTRTIEDLLKAHTEGVAKMLVFVRALP